MIRILVCVLILPAAVCCVASNALATANQSAGWALHYAGPHDSKANTCSFKVLNCGPPPPAGDIAVDAPGEPNRYDIYLIAVQVIGIAGTRYGICCDGPFYFYGWTSCSDFQISTSGWPGCGEGNAQTWVTEQTGPYVTIGILDVYSYGVSRLRSCVDPRKGFGEFCDGSSPEPECRTTANPIYFGIVGFGQNGYNPCPWDYVERQTWGAIKAQYR